MTEQEPKAPVKATVYMRGELLGQLLKTLLFALILFLLARLVILPYEVEGRSMTPNLVNNERVLVNRAVYSHVDPATWLDWIPGISVSESSWYPFHEPQRGDVIVLNPPTFSKTPYIKRTIGIAGDVIDVHDGSVFVNGVRLNEPYLHDIETTCESEEYCHDFIVPEGMIYVMGDNREESFDSRSFGPVPLDNIIGKAWFSNWPLDRIGVISH